MRPPLIALCGTAISSPVEDDLARAVGEQVAQAGAIGLCGGLGGVMSSAAQGVQAAGGVCIGFLPWNDAEEGNQFLTYAIPTGMGEMRNGLLAQASAGMVAIGGGYGTLSEIAFARRLDKPVVCLTSWGIARPGESEPDPSIHWSTDPREAVEWLLAQVSK